MPILSLSSARIAGHSLLFECLCEMALEFKLDAELDFGTRSGYVVQGARDLS